MANLDTRFSRMLLVDYMILVQEVNQGGLDKRAAFPLPLPPTQLRLLKGLIFDTIDRVAVITVEFSDLATRLAAAERLGKLTSAI
ncbi:hypothetical protein J6590_010528 [Homalodisca vitripennis]|nr:hypothetical protein J6590_010528 [Homalodisca vitripennis]